MNIETLNSSIRYSKTPSPCVELIWSSGGRVMALPTGFIAGADWKKGEEGEQVACDWGNWVITLCGHGLQRLPGALVRGEVCAIMEIPTDRAEVITGTVATQIRAIKKKVNEDQNSGDAQEADF